MTAYSVVLTAHSWLRWLVLGLLLASCAASLVAWARARPWREAHERLQRALVGVVDLQLTLGLLLYLWLSPFSRVFFAAPGVAMRDTTLRFFGIEHLTGMVVAVALIHVARLRSTRAPTPALRHRRAWSWTLAALLIITASLPWPGLRYGRPLLRPPPWRGV